MNTRRQSRETLTPRTAAPALAAATLVFLAGSLVGCASAPTPASANAGNAAIAGRPAYSRLRQLAATEKPHATEVPIPPGIDAAAITPVQPASPEAARKSALALDAAIAEVAASSAPAFTHVAPIAPEVDAARLHEAVRRYVNGRDLRQGSNAAGAITELEAAAQLDPTSPEILVELAEAQLAANRRLAASTSLQKAAALGTTSARVYWLLAIDAVRSNNAADAAWLLSKARSLSPEHQDPALPYLINAGLSEALGNLGYATASAGALEAALDLPEQLPSQTAYRLEYSELIRRQADRSRDLGDARARLGDFESAAKLYDLAAELPSLDPSAILARRVYARAKNGLPASAALILFESIEAAGGLVDERQLALIDTLLAKSSAAQPLSAAFTELQRSQSADLTPKARSGIIRAVAALSPNASQSPLSTFLAQHPDDREAMSDLLSPLSAEARLAAVSSLLASAKDPATLAQTAAETIVDSGAGIDASLNTLARRQDDASRLLQAHLLKTLSMPVAASELCADRKWSPAFEIAGAEVLAHASAIAGRWDRYDQALATLESKGEAAGIARVRALLAGQRFKAAAAVADQINPGADAPIGELLTLARAAQLTGKTDQAGGYLQQAIQTDRLDERSYEALLSLYAPAGQPIDNEKLGATLRSLRQNVPSSRLVRWFSAQDLVQRGSIAQAERALLTLADEDPGQARLIDVLAAIWERAPRTTQTNAEAWLRARLAKSPESTPLRGALARLLAKSGRLDEALSTCDLTFGGRSSPELLRVKERLLRESSKPDAADALAAERAAMLGTGIDASIDLAESHVNASRLAEAATTFDRGVPAGCELSPEQGARVSGFLSTACQNKAPTLSARDLSALFQTVASRDIKIPAQTHEAHIRRVATTTDVSASTMSVAARLAAAQYPKAGDTAYRQAAAALIDAGKRDVAASFLVAELKSIPEVKPDFVVDVFGLVVTSGDLPTINGFLDATDKPDWIDAIIIKSQASDELPDELDKKKVELAYTTGVVLNELGKDDFAAAAYRRALSLNPDHPMANNNLGYQIAEHNGDLAEAEGMLRRSVAALPDDASVLDSLGWILFKRNKLQDSPGPDGKPQAGALSLLARATTAQRGSENPTILDHYADVLWTAGKRDDAAEYWKRAKAACKIQLQMLNLNNTNGAPSSAVARYTKLQALINAKLEALQAGKEPVLADQPAPANNPAPATPGTTH